MMAMMMIFTCNRATPVPARHKLLSRPNHLNQITNRLSTVSSGRPSLSVTRRASSSTAHDFNHNDHQTFIEKIVQRYTVDLPPNKAVRAGDFVMLRPEHVMTHDNTAPVISKFNSIGASKISNPRQPVFTIDHDVQNKSPTNLKKYSKIEQFAHQQGVDFYPPGRGIGIMIEEGYAFPGVLMVASDSHSNMYGGVGCVGTPVVRTDAASIWATQRTWWQVPEIVKVQFTGSLPPGVTGKDVIVALCGNFNKDEVLNSAIEFTGEGVKSLSIDERLAISNMTTEWGALAGVFPIDDILMNWYRKELKKRERSTFIKSHSIPSSSTTHPRLSHSRVASLNQLAIDLKPDEKAFYSKTLTFDLSTLVPHVSGPNSVKISTPLTTLESQNIPINKAYLVSCVNSRTSDLKAAAEVMKGKTIAPGVEFYVAAASSVVQAQSETEGDWATLIQAGAKVLPAGCGPCIGLGTGLLEEGEVGISATNRNYKGRMGSPLAQAYLASPAVVAASAIDGTICGPSKLDNSNEMNKAQSPQITITKHHQSGSDLKIKSENQPDALLPNFPHTFSGPLVFAPCDNLNTDGIYPGKYTYQDDITPSQQAEVVMENYDKNFSKMISKLYPIEEQVEKVELKNMTMRAKKSNETGKGVILVSGFNFGTGSSREQAATALKNSGIPIVICGSFSDIFKRNSINNGLICLESPELINKLNEKFEIGKTIKDELNTIQTGFQLIVSCSDGKIFVDINDDEKLVFNCKPIGKSVQEIFLAGGLEGWVKQRI